MGQNTTISEMYKKDIGILEYSENQISNKILYWTGN